VANILKMNARLLRMGGRPIWIANSDIEPQLAALTIGNIPASCRTTSRADPPFEGTIRGKPLLSPSTAQTLTTWATSSWSTWTATTCATKQGGGIDFAASIHLFFDYNIQAFRWTFRFGGQPYLSAAVSPAKGANTKSHFVTLQAR
jgi:hypothetical protein